MYLGTTRVKVIWTVFSLWNTCKYSNILICVLGNFFYVALFMIKLTYWIKIDPVVQNIVFALIFMTGNHLQWFSLYKKLLTIDIVYDKNIWTKAYLSLSANIDWYVDIHREISTYFSRYHNGIQKYIIKAKKSKKNTPGHIANCKQR